MIDWPTPTDLSGDPELAVLAILGSVLEMTTIALVAADEDSPMSGPPFESASEQNAYATAIVHQIEALEGTLQGYSQSIRRLRNHASPGADKTACLPSLEVPYPLDPDLTPKDRNVL
jgi:hypothetical protein